MLHPPGVLLTRASSAIQGDDLVSADSSFAHWTHLSVGSGLQPLRKRNNCQDPKVGSNNIVIVSLCKIKVSPSYLMQTRPTDPEEAEKKCRVEING